MVKEPKAVAEKSEIVSEAEEPMVRENDEPLTKPFLYTRYLKSLDNNNEVAITFNISADIHENNNISVIFIMCLMLIYETVASKLDTAAKLYWAHPELAGLLPVETHNISIYNSYETNCQVDTWVDGPHKAGIG